MKKSKWLLCAGVVCMLTLTAGHYATAETTTNQTPQSEQREPARNRMYFHLMKDEMLKFLKLDEATFFKKVNEGKTLLQIGEEQGLTKKQMIDFYVKTMTPKIDEAQKAGHFSKEQADWMKKYLSVKAEMYLTKPNPSCSHHQGKSPVRNHVE